MEALVEITKMCIASPDARIEECVVPTEADLDEIWTWNHSLPPLHKFCMHEVISERAQSLPDKVAVSSWDGSLTYAQVDQYSAYVAGLLEAIGVTPHDVIPVCFEKSRWTIVAVLAAMKAGATFVLMDPTLPLARLQNMSSQVGAKTMLSSRMQYGISASVVPEANIIVVEACTFNSLPNLQLELRGTVVDPATLMYIIFTSGSTGTPKGVKISHATYSSSAIPRAKAVGYTEKSRVLDFASYAFDVSIDSMILTLANGGCLCIPSDEDRLNDINGAMRKMQVNYAGLTPSVARILEPDVIASLDGLGLGGEAASARDVTLWGRETRIIIGYGPCECTIGCTVNSSAATGRDYISIGRGNGAVIWVVIPDNHHSLLPVGAVGELLVEGPIVGQGYLNDPKRTEEVFIEDPSWLTAGYKSFAGRRGRLYKTGDLGKYDPDGSGGIVFVGRKDTQVKLRGQRVELGEIESQLIARLPAGFSIIAEVIVPRGKNAAQATLVAFVATNTSRDHKNDDLTLVALSEDIQKILTQANEDIATVLPRYMVPTAYIPVNSIPSLISGKTDRKRLKEFGVTVDLQELDKNPTSLTGRQLTHLEHLLRQIWSQTLQKDADTIRLHDNFFALGGDSVMAMKLVSLCKTKNLDLSVTRAFTHPTLLEMARIVSPGDLQPVVETPPFSMIDQTIEKVCLEAANACGLDKAAIEDIYPCTPTQESLFTFSLKSVKPYIAQRVACLPRDVSIDSWKSAWEEVVATTPMLRTRVAQLDGHGLRQVVVSGSVTWQHTNDLAEYLTKDQEQRMDLGQPLARYAIIDQSADGKRYMVWTVHHVLYDGWSEPQILRNVRKAMQGHRTRMPAQMRDFVRHVRGTDNMAMREFWRQELRGAVGPQFPPLPSRDFLPIPDTTIERQVSFTQSDSFPFTSATVIRAAWALVASQHSGSGDVVFGETLTGRDIHLQGVESIIGPLIATVPIRIRVEGGITVESYLRSVQRVLLERIPYQHMGMQHIRKVSQDAQYACEAGTGIVISPETDHKTFELGFQQKDVLHEALHFNPYPLMLAFGISKAGFRVCANFDSRVVKVTQLARMLGQLEVAFSQLIQNLSKTVDEISCMSNPELDQIWQWNQEPPLSIEKTTRLLRAGPDMKSGSKYPPAMVAWVCNLRNPSLLSPINSVGELWLEGHLLPGETVESPKWLLAGSSACVGRSGRVQRTHDIVRLEEDGRITFVGRKDDSLHVNGHDVDTGQLEAYVLRHLPSAYKAAVAASYSPEYRNPQQQHELIVLIEQHHSEEDSVQLMSEKHTMTVDVSGTPSTLTVLASIPNSLSVALKQLQRSVKESLPSPMVPSAYVVVDKIPTRVDRSSLNQLASMIPRDLLHQHQLALQQAWAASTKYAEMTVAETILRSAWANILGIRTEEIEVDDNFFRLGGDSVLAMKLVSALRMQGHSLTVADVFQHMRLGNAAKVLKVDHFTNSSRTRSYVPFSTLTHVDVDHFSSQVVRPKLADACWSVQDVCPVTDSQELDIRGTIHSPRTSIQYTILYFEKAIDLEPLGHACRNLVRTHQILRTVFVKHESAFFQVVLTELPITISTLRTQKPLEQYTKELCASDIESDYRLGSPFLKLVHVQASDGRECLILGLSHAQYDGVSLPRVLQDLETFYRGEKSVELEPFSTYIAQTQDKDVQTKALVYWRNLLQGSSLSYLDGDLGRIGDKAMLKARPVDVSQLHRDITSATLLTAAWALTLARRLKSADVTFGGVTSGRNIDAISVENICGPCYQFTPVRVLFHSKWTAIDLLNYVQRQSAQSAAHDFLGFREISKNCTQWPPETSFYGSLVHHQDTVDLETMPFAGQTCRVEVLKPHGDAAYPFKVVSFVQGGQMHIGVVGSDRDPGFLDDILGEVVAAGLELAAGQSEHILLDL